MNICVVTTTRADYGLLKPLIRRFLDDKIFCVKIVVTGTHLSEKYGYTYKEIEKDGFQTAARIAILSEEKDSLAVPKCMANAIVKFSEYFQADRPDFVLLLGDRYETFAIAIAAYNARIPIIHLYGGDTTEGALDEAYRHSITKMSYLHFVSNEDSRRRVIQLGEEPERVFNVGSLGIENVLHEPLMSMEELERDLHFQLGGSYAVVTFHPVTLEADTAEAQCGELLRALEKRKDLRYIITKSNADENGGRINSLWDKYGEQRDNVYVTESLGMKRYLSAVSHARMVIGNSSSGLSEVPAFHVPTVNIGDRQKGRLRGKSVVDCLPKETDILRAMDIAESTAFLKEIQEEVSVYGDGHTSEKIVDIVRQYMRKNTINQKKNFYNIMRPHTGEKWKG